MVRRFDARWTSSSAMLGLVPAMMLSTMAQAADAPPSTPAAATGTQLEEITVTARRTSENLIKTPVAVAMIDAAQIAARGIKGEFFDRHLRLVGTVYYGDWRNRHVSA